MCCVCVLGVRVLCMRDDPSTHSFYVCQGAVDYCIGTSTFVALLVYKAVITSVPSF